MATNGAFKVYITLLYWYVIFFVATSRVVDNIMNQLDESPYQGVAVAKLLGIPASIIDKPSQEESEKELVRRLMYWWVGRTDNAKWSNIQQVLQGMYIGYLFISYPIT